MATTATAIRNEFEALANDAIAEHSQRFFKTGKGEYGDNDRFLGIRIPLVRQQVKRHRDAPMRAIKAMLKSPWHEERMFGVLSLVDRFKRGDETQQQHIFDYYLGNIRFVNNWDLVDSSAHLIVGPWLETRSRRRLYRLAKSKDLWERRVAIISSYHFIRGEDFSDTLALAELLVHDEHDLIHKAVGWMLREVGNRDRKAEVRFLKKHYRSMPRTMLRYAIEKFPQAQRKAWLQGKM